MRKQSFKLFSFAVAILIFWACISENKPPQLRNVSITENTTFLEKLKGDSDTFLISKVNKRKSKLWQVTVLQNLNKGMCSKDFYEGKIVLEQDTLYLLADYLYNTPKYRGHVVMDLPIGFCTCVFDFVIKSSNDLSQYIIVFENEMSDQPVSSHFLEEYYRVWKDALPKKEIAGCENKLVFFTDTDSLEVLKDDYYIAVNEKGFNIYITSGIKHKAILRLEKPKIAFCINGEKTLAKPHDISSSRIPDDTGFIFSVTTGGTIAVAPDNSISVRKVK